MLEGFHAERDTRRCTASKQLFPLARFPKRSAVKLQPALRGPLANNIVVADGAAARIDTAQAIGLANNIQLLSKTVKRIKNMREAERMAQSAKCSFFDLQVFAP